MIYDWCRGAFTYFPQNIVESIWSVYLNKAMQRGSSIKTLFMF